MEKKKRVPGGIEEIWKFLTTLLTILYDRSLYEERDICAIFTVNPFNFSQVIKIPRPQILMAAKFNGFTVLQER